jgi:hypothetical protein
MGIKSSLCLTLDVEQQTDGTVEDNLLNRKYTIIRWHQTPVSVDIEIIINQHCYKRYHCWLSLTVTQNNIGILDANDEF